jgi:hypothetical protein
MNKAHWILLALLSMVALSAQTSFAQCARGTVTVQGRVENLPQGARADVLVLLKTPKGDFSKTSSVADGKFRVEVGFSTLKSWSALTGHHCSNRPTLVEVTLKQADRVLAQKSLKFADEFESRDSLTYSLKREVTLNAGGNGVTASPKP